MPVDDEDAGRVRGGGPGGGVVIVADLESEVGGAQSVHRQAGDVDHDAVDAHRRAGVVGEGGRAAGQQGDLGRVDGIVIGETLGRIIPVAVVVEEVASGDLRGDIGCAGGAAGWTGLP